MWSTSLSFMMVLSLSLKKNVADLCSLHDTQRFYKHYSGKAEAGLGPKSSHLLLPDISQEVPRDGISGAFQMLGNKEEQRTDEQTYKKLSQ